MRNHQHLALARPPRERSLAELLDKLQREREAFDRLYADIWNVSGAPALRSTRSADAPDEGSLDGNQDEGATARET